jgi:predicted Zn-dependent peptidase
MPEPARTIERDVLPNGLTVITEPMPHVRSVSVGVWLRAGSRREPAARAGLSHFIEHMLFKGTERRTAEQIAREMDSIGGLLDAFTEKEIVCYNAKVLDEHLPIAFDLLADLVLRPRFDPDELEREKQVVLEEIRMEEDNPEYVVHEIFTQGFWPAHPLGRPILGTPESVSAFTRQSLWETFRTGYAPNNAIITAAGRIEHARLVDLAAREFGSSPSVPQSPIGSPPSPDPVLVSRSKRELGQSHICLGVPSYRLADERRFALSLLNNVLGGGMSSRLFQNIRERQGLAYAVFSELNPCSDTGCLTIYAGTSRESANRVVESIMKEFRDLKENVVAAEELRRAKDHLKGSLMLSLESTTSRMSNLARQEIYFGRFFSLDEIAQRIENVTADEVIAVANEFFRPQAVAVTVVGNLTGVKIGRRQLVC